MNTGFFSILCCAAVGVGDVSDDIVGLFEHPVIAPGDDVLRMDGLDSSIKNILYRKSQNPKLITIKMICDGLGITLREFFATPDLLL